MPDHAAAPRTDRLAVTLAGARFHVRVGVLPHERELPQPLEVDVTAWPGGDAGAGAAAGVFDYRALYAAAAAAVANEPLRYLEDVAAEVAERVLAGGGAGHVRVAVRKPHVAMPGPVAYAEVVLERGRVDA